MDSPPAEVMGSPSRSLTPTTCRGRRRTSVSTEPNTAYRRARSPTAACVRSTSAAVATGRTTIPAGVRKSTSTSRWSRRSARPATSFSSRRTPRALPILRRQSIAPPRWAPSPSPTVTERPKSPSCRRWPRTTTTQASRSSRAAATTATGSRSPLRPYTSWPRAGPPSAARRTLRGWTETAWSGAGSGCSTLETKPAWQADSGCANRTVADISAVADPDTGVAMYDPDYGGWDVWGGTSASAPIIAAMATLARVPAPSSYPAADLYANAGPLNDVTSGNNGGCGSYLCIAGTGYDGPTGWAPRRA